MITWRPVLPDLPLYRKHGQHERPPVVAYQAGAGNLVFGEEFCKFKIMDELVFENDVVVVPKHLVIEGIGKKQKAYDN